MMGGLLPLYEECVRRGLSVVGLAGWREHQEGYWFREEGQWAGSGRESNPPTCFVNHHTATPKALGYMPNVKNSKGQSKANIWLGIRRSPSSARIYQSGPGIPTAFFAVRWAGNYTNGACDRTVYERFVWRGIVAPNRPSGRDDGYANHLGPGMEIVHEGTGAECDPGVWELAAQINAAARYVWRWDLSRILDHRSSTTRKQDLNFGQREDGYTINALRTRIVEIGEPQQEEEQMLKLDDSGDTVRHYQGRLNDWRSTAPLDVDGEYGQKTKDKVLSFQATEEFPERMRTGEIGGLTAARLDSFAEDLVDVKLRRDLVAVQQESNAADAAHAETPHGDEEHTHPQYALDGHTHPGLAIVTHTHPFTGNTEGATQP